MEKQKVLQIVQEAIEEQNKLLQEAKDNNRSVGTGLHSYSITQLKRLKERIENE